MSVDKNSTFPNLQSLPSFSFPSSLSCSDFSVPNQLDPQASRFQGSSRLPLALAWGLQGLYSFIPSVVHGCRGAPVRSPHLPCNHFTSWAFSLTPTVLSLREALSAFLIKVESRNEEFGNNQDMRTSPWCQPMEKPAASS